LWVLVFFPGNKAEGCDKKLNGPGFECRQRRRSGLLWVLVFFSGGNAEGLAVKM
jgi:hypothetical protein